MLAPPAILVASVLTLLFDYCHAAAARLRPTQCLDFDFEPNYYFGNLAECTTAHKFCSSLLGPVPATRTLEPLLDISTRTVKEKGVMTSTHFLSDATTTFTSTAPAVTLTKGRRTTTIHRCPEVDIVTCGPFVAEIDQNGPSRELAVACDCFLEDTAFVTETSQVFEATTVIFASTHVVTKTRLFVAETTVTPIITLSVKTATHTICDTLPAPTKHCDKGIEWALFTIEAGDVPGGTIADEYDLEGWDPAIYKTRTPQFTGMTDDIGGIFAKYYFPSIYIYGHALAPYNIVVNYQAYLYATENGTYQFDFPSVMTTAYVWVGDVAYSGWNLSNALQGGTKFLEAGKYHPFRVIWGIGSSNYQYPDYDPICDYHQERCSDFYFQIFGPDDVLIMGEYGAYPAFSSADGAYSYALEFVDSPDVFQHCRGKAAPEFPPWGQQT